MTVPTLYPIDAAEVRRRWDYMRGGVVQALRHDTDGTMPEDVFASLMAGHSQAWLATHNDDPTQGPEGFIIARVIYTAGGSEFLVWIGYHNGDEGRAADYLPQMASMALEADCHRVVFESPRPYHRAIPGMKLARYVYHYEVNHG